jgi:hypothetical protein
MKISPRKAEIEAVVALLRDSGFETAEQGAAAVVKLVAELLGARSWRVYAHRFTPDARPLLYGPFATTNKVQEFAGKAGIPGEHAVFWLHSPQGALVSIEDTDRAPTKYCTACGHLIEVHGLLPKRREACTIQGCECGAPISGGKAE